MPTARRTTKKTNKKPAPVLPARARAILRLETEIGRSALEEYVNYLHEPWRIFWANLVAGVARGIGWVLGGTLLIAVLIFILAQLTAIPVVGEYFRWISESIRHTGG